MRAWIARSCKVPAHLASVSAPGIGLRITDSSPEYDGFIASLALRSSGASGPRVGAAPAAPASTPRESPPEPPPPPAESEMSYRVRVKHTSGPRSRSIVVVAASRECAGAQVMEELGDDWKVIEIERA